MHPVERPPERGEKVLQSRRGEGEAPRSKKSTKRGRRNATDLRGHRGQRQGWMSKPIVDAPSGLEKQEDTYYCERGPGANDRGKRGGNEITRLLPER